MSDHVWNVPINDLELDAEVFVKFLAALDLDFLSYLLIIMLPTFGIPSCCLPYGRRQCKDIQLVLMIA
ncbi:hypothetical protein RHMOL_Rhmol01G0165200 [Rhododendron molle]|uniref:Uncharacterized protein n=1 Tax=Rhododendron molle TaxID=49168 RepID=A0ACC0Q2F4_RHOML|nr:hypothetical protein RHMOL_Rhmol01G0165200 [Rhododendron molle]